METTSDNINPSLLIETDELAFRLTDENLRIIDCDIILSSNPEGGYDVVSGRGNWSEAHIPNSIYIDIGEELSADHSRLPYMLPSAQQFSKVMSDHGIGNGHEVVLYSRGGNFWATRLYLMFREFGFDNVRVLNGAWDKWASEGKPVSSTDSNWPKTEFVANEPRGIFVGKDEVLAALNDENVCIVNALSPKLHSGEAHNPSYGRPGHIAGSVNLFFMKLIDRESNCFLEQDALRRMFDDIGALNAERIVAYCGGGISATANTFALHLLGKTNVVVYDASLSEWGHDPSLPMETCD
jgi:thiosulfate/3-mercaptopyruvate sulfurtransferase